MSVLETVCICPFSAAALAAVLAVEEIDTLEVTVVFDVVDVEFVTTAPTEKLSIVKDIARIFIVPPNFALNSF